MAQPDGSKMKRIDVTYLDGLNSHPSWNLATRQEMSHAENARSTQLGCVERRDGYAQLGDDVNATSNFGVFRFDSANPLSSGAWRVTDSGAGASYRYLSNSSVWTALAGEGAGIPYVSAPVSVTTAEGRAFIVNGETENRSIEKDGVTVKKGVTVTTLPIVDNDFANSPMGAKVNFYKGQLYLANVTYGGSSYPNQVHMSSPLMGVVALVSGDYASTAGEVQVTDTKYIYVKDTLDVFRGDQYITTLDVVDKTETSIILSGPVGFALLSSDELWVSQTNPVNSPGVRRFRWATSPTGGMPVKKWDTFTLTGGGDQAVTMLVNVGSYQMIANADSMAAWDGANLQVLDTGIGCVSPQGYVKFAGNLFFVHWTGVYVTSGGLPKLVSTPVDSFIKGATKAGLANAVCGRHGLSVFFCIGDVTLRNRDGSVFRELEDVMLEYDQEQDNWYAHTGIPASSMATYVAADVTDRLFFSSESPGRAEVFSMFEGAADDAGSDAEREIPFRIDTALWQLCANEETVGVMDAVVLHVDRGNSVGCFVDLDGTGDFYELRGQFDKGVEVVPVTERDDSRLPPPSSRLVRLSFRSNGRAKPRLTKLSLRYFETQAEPTNPR